jgi:hypothetical protein
MFILVTNLVEFEFYKESFNHKSDKTPVRTTWKKEGFLLAHGFRSFCSLLAGFIVFGPWWVRESWRGARRREKLITSLWLGSKESERGALDKTQPTGHIYHDLLPPTRLPLKKNSNSSKIVHHLKTKPSIHEIFGETLHIQTITFHLWPPKDSCPFQNVKCIQPISKGPHGLNSSSIIQKSEFKISSETQGKL